MRKNKGNKYIFLLMFLSFFLFAAPVRAAELEEVLIEPNQDRAEITVTLPEEQQEEITSLRLGFQLKVVKGEPEGVKASFLFAENLPAAVQEYRYQKEKETLYVYLSGREDLFKEQQLSLGTILLESSQEDGAQVSLSLIPDSLELVNQAYGELDVTLAEEPEEFLTVGRRRLLTRKKRSHRRRIRKEHLFRKAVPHRRRGIRLPLLPGTELQK